MKWALLRNSLFIGLIPFILLSCASDRRVDYNSYPEFKEAKELFGETYLRTVAASSEFYDDDDAFHHALRDQIKAMYAVRILMSDSVEHFYNQLTKASSQEVFQDEFVKMNQRKMAVQEGDLPPDTERPLIDWEAILENMHTELELRNERVREMRAKKELIKSDSTLTDTIPGGFSVMPVN